MNGRTRQSGVQSRVARDLKVILEKRFNLASKHVILITTHPGCRNAIEDVVVIMNNKENENNEARKRCLITIM